MTQPPNIHDDGNDLNVIAGLLARMEALGPDLIDLLTPATLGLRRTLSNELSLKRPSGLFASLAQLFGNGLAQPVVEPPGDSEVLLAFLRGGLGRLEQGGNLGNAARLLELCRLGAELRPWLRYFAGIKGRKHHLLPARRAYEQLRSLLRRSYPFDSSIARLWVQTEQALRAGFVMHSGF